GVEIGIGFRAASLRGSQAHDRVRRGAGGTLRRPTNRAGGTEGGMTNGQPVVVRAAMKPLSTLRRPLESVNLKTRAREEAHFERSDVTAVPAASVVCESAVAFVLAQAFREKFGGDSLREMRRNVEGYYAQIAESWRP
ncbi:MAG: chorismate synthase, partial [Planctomycetota bacterium]